MGSEQIIETRDLRRTFKAKAGAVEAVAGVTLGVATGDIFGFLGPNGAGKTTTLRILATLLPPTSGEATVAGFDVAHRPDQVRRQIGYVAQSGGSYRGATGREELVIQGRLFDMRKADAQVRAQEILDALDLAEAADRPCSTYSGGMRRRLDIAMSLIGNPPVIFLDEPTTGLDPQGRLEVWDAVKALAQGGTTVLLTTQYLDEAEQLADQIAILHGGRIIINGTLAELKALLPAAKVEYVEKQPTLEDVFLAIVGDTGIEGTAGDSAGTDRTGTDD